MSDRRQAKVLFATLVERTSGKGNVYLSGWAGASNLLAFRGDDDDRGQPTWNLYLVERQPREGTSRPANSSRPPRQDQGQGDAGARPQHGHRRAEHLDDDIPF